MTLNLASTPHRYRFAAIVSLLVVLGMVLAACGGGGNTTTPAHHATTLRVQFAPAQPNPDLFNPFFNNNQGGDWGAQGLLYEELYFTKPVYRSAHTLVGCQRELLQRSKAKDSQHNQDFFAPSNTVMLYLNLSKAPFNNLLVRKAINAAINRSQLPQGVALYAKVANPTGVMVPTFNNWLSSQYQNAPDPYNVSQAGSYLEQAGFKKGSDGFYRDASGKVFSMAVDVVNGWSDWDQDVQFIVNDLNKAGIKATLNSESGFTPYYTAITSGNYDAAISWTDSGPTPYYAYRDMLNSANAADLAAKKAAVGTNFESWKAATSNGLSAQTDGLLNQYKASPDGSPAQMQAIQGIEDIMVNQLPAIPLTVNVTWDEYRTANWTGWPDASSPYDVGPPYQMPDAANVILHLTPAS